MASADYLGPSEEDDVLSAAARPTSERPHTSVFRGSLVIGASRVLQLVAGFLIGAIVSRALGTSGKGELTLLQQFPVVAALLLGFGVANANTYFVGRRERSAEESVSDSLMFALAVSALGVPLLVYFMRAFVPALGGVGTWVLWLAALSVPLSLGSGMITGVLVGQGRLTGMSIGQMVSTGLTFVLVAAFFVLKSLTVPMVIIISLVASAIGLGVLLGATGARRAHAPSVSRLREGADYARRSYVASIAGYLELRQDTLLLGILSSASSVGIYSVGVSFAELMWHLPQTVGSAIAARAYQEDHASGSALTASVTRLTTATMLATTVLLALFLRPFIIRVFGAAFAPAATVFLLLVPGIFITGVSNPLASYLSAHGTLFPGISSLAVGANLLLNVILIPRYGYYGAAIASTISYAIGGSYIVHIFLRESETSLRNVLFPHAKDLALVRAAVRTLVSKRHPTD